MSEAQASQISPQRDDTATRARAVLVLVAEDEEPIAEIIATVIQELDATPIVAAHGREALALARQAAPALIITDLMMPLMDGAELIATLRAEAAERGTQPPPVILMTASGRENAARAGADVVLPKPFDLAALEDLLRHYLALP
ncbi:MAG: hypothetical protein AVDCRST_MAG18-909 [uncultured Thermomicrobiales bacterium]|uniref:Response regulatory domain-containing protein n=1 Tax=uncultured Thermomicrobiales bacterium TaxID=1645740 RepID=A0A6J4URL8_9BACT|nr:MAG: hypothetical protein AVDCRST_MAG18-909 [uncultured Thermomicrobiales bacterium]